MSPFVVNNTTTPVAASFVLCGSVQGIGVRPAIARLAASLSLCGDVSNESEGVHVHVEGDPARIIEFSERLVEALPAAAVVEELRQSRTALRHLDQFQIPVGSYGGPLATHVPRDLAVCSQCLEEAASAGNRREDYPFTGCTNCGPRYSIIESMPYERANSSMQAFELCANCAAEFTDSADRRFHAQTTACSACGPALCGVDASGNVIQHGEETVRPAAAVLLDGGVVAIKGLGGYQLLCDATSADAVVRLRLLKQRRRKPLAVMLDGPSFSEFFPSDLTPLDGPANPIVLVPASAIPGVVGDVFPSLDTIGVMRPTTPLHWLLLRETGRPLVVTSGNIEGEPLAYENGSAVETLGAAADLTVHHNRSIIRPVDDSVVRVIANRTVTIRCARGIAPLPLNLPHGPPVLAVGGHQKVAVALCNGRQSVLGPHLGDLDSLASRKRFVEQTRQLIALYGNPPEMIVHDLHPDYHTTRWAQQQQLPTMAVQHHHAHVVAGMVEHGWLDETVLGVAFDGTGWGPDESIWGGEFLLTSTDGYERVASLRPFLLPGGEQAIRQPWRIALTLMTEVFGAERAMQTLSRIIEPERLRSLLAIVQRRIGPRTSSVGRLFDAVAALVLGVHESSYEGEPAAQLEAVCQLSAVGEYPFPLEESTNRRQLDWRPLLRALHEDLNRGIPAGTVAMRFHRSVAIAVELVVRRYSQYPVVLGGGCFQNRILTELIAEKLAQHAHPIGLPGVIPPNDGGLAAGQLAIALATLQETSHGGKEVSCV